MVFFSLISWFTHLLSLRNILHYSSKLSGHGIHYFIDMEKENKVYLTYNLSTEINPDRVNDLLNILNQEDINATFFISTNSLIDPQHKNLLSESELQEFEKKKSEQMKAWSTLVQNLIEQGHDVGNAYDRSTSASELSEQDLELFLRQSEKILQSFDKDFIYKSPKFFRNCLGTGSRSMNQTMEANDYEQIKGDVFNMKGDFTDDPGPIAKSMVSNIHKGSIIILPFKENDKLDNVIEVSKLIIKGTRERNFSFANLDSVFRMESYLKKLDL